MAMGRPRTFDVDEAVRAALRLFIAKGYEGASSGELASVMGISPPSLHAAFGNKEGLFRRALDAYAGMNGPIIAQACAKQTSRSAVEAYLCGNADALTDPAKPAGCLLVQGALACGDRASPIREELARQRASAEPVLKARFEAARDAGDLPPDTDPTRLARYVAAVSQGMAVQASGGSTRAELQDVIEAVLDTWPGRA